TQPVILVEDAFGNVMMSDNTTQVVASLNTGTGPLQGTTTLTVSNGVASFANLSNNKAETISLDFTSAGLTKATSNNIQVEPADTTTSVVSSINTSTYGQAVTFTATVTANSPSTLTPLGTVQFVIDGSNFGGPVTLDANGMAVSAS